MAVNVTLVHEARRLTTGANVHRVNGLIAMYLGAESDGALGAEAARQFEAELVEHVRVIRVQRAKQGIYQ